MSVTEVEKRLAHMESLLSHQEGVIQDLSDVAARQGADLEDLTRMVKGLKDHIVSLDDDLRDVLPLKADTPPPHY